MYQSTMIMLLDWHKTAKSSVKLQRDTKAEVVIKFEDPEDNRASDVSILLDLKHAQSLLDQLKDVIIQASEAQEAKENENKPIAEAKDVDVTSEPEQRNDNIGSQEDSDIPF